MKRKFLCDISLNTLQVLIVQSCGLIIFYLLSTQLNKNDFGYINWALAVLLTAFGILTFGIDQIAVRRIAAGYDPAQLLSTYIAHVLIAGCIFYIVLWSSSVIFSPFFYRNQFLLLFGVGKLMIFFSTPFKQLATGLEKYKSLLIMAITSNVLRAVALLIFTGMYQLNVKTIAVIFIAGDIAELLVCIFIMERILKVPLKLKWQANDYIGLVKEAFPQFGVTIFTSALSRLDWVFLGILSTNIILAEYSFAYKVFEAATLPMVVIAPVLITRFTKLFHNNSDVLSNDKTIDLFVLLRLEIIVASFFALCLSILWVPVIDLVTDHRYGAVNQTTIFLLSLSMPFLYLNNFLWTINFARGQLKMIFFTFLISFVFNLAGNIILIPIFNAEGAAIAYLIAIIAQSLMYIFKTELTCLRKTSLRLLLCPLAAVASGFLAINLFKGIWLHIFLAPFFFILLLFLSGQVKLDDWPAFKRVTHL